METELFLKKTFCLKEHLAKSAWGRRDFVSTDASRYQDLGKWWKPHCMTQGEEFIAFALLKKNPSSIFPTEIFSKMLSVLKDVVYIWFAVCVHPFDGAEFHIWVAQCEIGTITHIKAGVQVERRHKTEDTPGASQELGRELWISRSCRIEQFESLPPPP